MTRFHKLAFSFQLHQLVKNKRKLSKLVNGTLYFFWWDLRGMMTIHKSLRVLMSTFWKEVSVLNFLRIWYLKVSAFYTYYFFKRKEQKGY